MASTQTEKAREIKNISIAEIWPNPDQPRTESWGNIDGLKTTMEEQGLVQYPVVIPKKQKKGKGKYMLISGERRWRAARKIRQKKRLTCIIRRDIENKDIFRLSFMENMQRQSLNPIEEAKGFQRLIKEDNLNPSEVARILGVSAPKVYNALKLLDLPEEIKDQVAQKKLSPVSVAGLHSIPDKRTQIKVAKQIVKKKLPARQAQELILDTMAEKNKPLKDGRSVKQVRMERSLATITKFVEELNVIIPFWEKLSRTEKNKFIETINDEGGSRLIDQMREACKFLDDLWRRAD